MHIERLGGCVLSWRVRARLQTGKGGDEEKAPKAAALHCASRVCTAECTLATAHTHVLDKVQLHSAAEHRVAAVHLPVVDEDRIFAETFGRERGLH